MAGVGLDPDSAKDPALARSSQVFLSPGKFFGARSNLSGATRYFEESDQISGLG